MAMTKPKSSQIEHRGESVQKVIDDLTQQDGVLTSESQWSDIPKLKGVNANRQALALANRTELIRNVVLQYATYAQAEQMAQKLVDGQRVQSPDADGLVCEFVVSGGSLVFSKIIERFDAVSVFDFMTPAQIKNVKSGLATHDVTAEIQAAIDHLSSIGGGVLLLPKGSYLVSSSTARRVYVDDGSVYELRDVFAALWVPANIILRGTGSSKLIRRSAAGASYMIGLIDCNDTEISGVELHGPGATGNAMHGIITNSTTPTRTNRNIKLHNLFIHHFGSYGIGNQSGGSDGVVFRDIRIEDVGADGIDHKVRYSDLDAQFNAGRATVFDNIIVRRHGQRLDDSSGIDIRGVATLTHIHVSEFGRSTGYVTGVRFSGGTYFNQTTQLRQASARSSMTSFFVEGDPRFNNTIGVTFISSGPVAVSNGLIHWCGRAVQASPGATPSVWESGPSISNVVAEGAIGDIAAFSIQQPNTKLHGCTALSDVRYFDAKRNNISQGQTRVQIFGGVRSGVVVVKNDLILNSGTDYSVDGDFVVLSEPLALSDTLKVIHPTLRAARVEQPGCIITGLDFDDWALNGLSVSSGGLPGGVFVGNKMKGGGLTVPPTNGPTKISAIGDAADIDVFIEPQGEGRVRFGSVTATSDAPISGYISIRDASGTSRRLAVIS